MCWHNCGFKLKQKHSPYFTFQLRGFCLLLYICIVQWVMISSLNLTRDAQEIFNDFKPTFKMCLSLYYIWQLHQGLWKNCAWMCHMSWQACQHLLLAMTTSLTYHQPLNVIPPVSGIQFSICGCFKYDIHEPFMSLSVKIRWNQLFSFIFFFRNVKIYHYSYAMLWIKISAWNPLLHLICNVYRSLT